MSAEEKEETREPRGLYERLKTEERGWELWAKLGVALLVAQLLAFIVAFLKLGQPSVYAYSVAIPLMGFMTFPLTFWGLLRAIFRPPIFRMSRTYGFLALVVVGYFGNQPTFAAPVSTTEWESSHEYLLPFEGPWVTLAGGDEKEVNYHVTTPAHRWAYDFAPLVDGRRYRGDGSELEDHHCYGREVYAPAGGVVIQALGGEPDHQPGKFDPNNILGNHVVVRVDDEEYLFLAHLKRGSLEVRPGDVVEQGQLVARCGNSGRSYTPHLHVHLQNQRGFPMAEGLPLRFSGYRADGDYVALGMPQGSPDYEKVVGQIVESTRQPAEHRVDSSEAVGVEEEGEPGEVEEETPQESVEAVNPDQDPGL